MSPCPPVPLSKRIWVCALRAFGLGFFVVVAHLLGTYFLELETRTTLTDLVYSIRVFLMVFVLSFMYMIGIELID